MNGSFKNMAIGVNGDGYRKVIGAAEGLTESAVLAEAPIMARRARLTGVRMFTRDKAAAMTSVIAEVFLGTAYQKCTVQFFCNVLSKVPQSKGCQGVVILKSIHAQRPFDAGMEKASVVNEILGEMSLTAASKCVRVGIVETLTYTRFPMQH